MEKTIFDVYNKEEIEKFIIEINNLISKGFKDEEILNKINFESKEELLSIARARIKTSKDLGKYLGNVKYFNLYDLRFSTSLDVAKYRAKRLKCKKIVDLCSGIGIQAAAFADYSKEVYAFEIDSKKVRYARENYPGKKNLNFFVGDVLSDYVIEKVKEIKPDIVFCDPERLASEKERTIDSIKPDIKKLLEIYSKISPNLCIEIPPQIELGKLNSLGEFEAEYLSYENKLNRLDLYFGELKKSVVSVADAVTFDRIESSNKDINASFTKDPRDYIYELSPAIIKADLYADLSKEINAPVLFGAEKGKVLLTSNELTLEHKELFKTYELVSVVNTFKEVTGALKNNGFGKVLLKYSIDPKDYWKERNKLEKGLRGDEEAVIFLVNNNYLICQEI